MTVSHVEELDFGGLESDATIVRKFQLWIWVIRAFKIFAPLGALELNCSIYIWLWLLICS